MSLCVKDFEILTDEGFKKFNSVIRNGNNEGLEIFTNLKSVKVSLDHILFSTDNTQKIANTFKIGDEVLTVDGYEIVTDVQPCGVIDTYDIVGSENYKYVTNGFVSHQCLLLDELSWIEPDSMVQDFMSSVLPTISRAKTSKILITSTPRGKNNVFYRMYNAATKVDTDEWNEFHAEQVHWNEIPGRDEEWKKKEIAKMGSHEQFEQEYNCVFLDDGTAAMDVALFEELRKDCTEPKIILKDGHYKIWEEYDAEKIYAAGVDVSEGVDQDASVIQILDITDLREITQVAEYHNNKIAPAEFSNELHEILQHWGSPCALIERNNQGGQICDRLAIDFAYPNVVSWGAKEAHKNKQNGIISHTNTKYKAVLNERYFINEMRAVKFRSLQTLNEFKSFMRMPNGSWKAKSGDHDDRVMAFVWALMILYNEITQDYFEIVEEDDYGKPLKIRPIDMGLHLYRPSTSIYTNEEVEKIEQSNLAPMLFGGMGSAAINDLAELEAQGWYFPNGSPNYDPSKEISYEKWELLEKYY